MQNLQLDFLSWITLLTKLLAHSTCTCMLLKLCKSQQRSFRVMQGPSSFVKFIKDLCSILQILFVGIRLPLVIVKKSSPKNLSADWQSVFRATPVGQQMADSRPTDGRQLADRFFGELFTIMYLIVIEGRGILQIFAQSNLLQNLVCCHSHLGTNTFFVESYSQDPLQDLKVATFVILVNLLHPALTFLGTLWFIISLVFSCL